MKPKANDYLKMEEMIEIKSRELIKPSSPTPPHLKTYHFSFLDQFTSNTYVPILLFYPPKQVSIYKKTQLLKQSLSKTLSLYHPLAGELKDYLSIDCNDQGVHYIEATIYSTSNDYFNNLKIPSLVEFMPEKIVFGQLKQGSPACMIQVTEFSCGGFAIGVVVSHRVFDGPSLVNFLKTWASFCRSHSESPHQFPDFTSSHIFPQNRDFPPNLTLSSITAEFLPRKGNYVLRRILFDGTAISHLKSKAVTSGLHNPSRSEVVQGVLFKSIMSAMKEKSVFVSNSINVRRRSVPPLPETIVGNFVALAPSIFTEEETEFCCYAKKLRETTSVINGEFMRKLKGEEGFVTFIDYLKSIREITRKARDSELPVVLFNSWCNMGSYDVDFGWGKPVWVPPVLLTLPVHQLFIQLMDVRHGNGIEAWVVMEEKEMHALTHDEEILSLVSLDPNPLHYWIRGMASAL